MASPRFRRGRRRDSRRDGRDIGSPSSHVRSTSNDDQAQEEQHFDAGTVEEEEDEMMAEMIMEHRFRQAKIRSLIYQKKVLQLRAWKQQQIQLQHQLEVQQKAKILEMETADMKSPRPPPDPYVALLLEKVDRLVEAVSTQNAAARNTPRGGVGGEVLVPFKGQEESSETRTSEAPTPPRLTEADTTKTPSQESVNLQSSSSRKASVTVPQLQLQHDHPVMSKVLPPPLPPGPVKTDKLTALGSKLTEWLEDIDNDEEQSTMGGGQQIGNSGIGGEPGTENSAAVQSHPKHRITLEARKAQAELANRLQNGINRDLRRPRWRWEKDGIMNPTDDQLLRGAALFRSVAQLVCVFLVRPQKAVSERYSKTKSVDASEWATTLALYEERCRVWALRTVRLPVSAVLQDATLNLRMVDQKTLNRLKKSADYNKTEIDIDHTKQISDLGKSAQLKKMFTTGVLNATTGISQKVAQNSSSMQLRQTRLKVFLKGVVDGLSREPLPSEVIKFLSFLVNDGNYFPKDWLFEGEKSLMMFSKLGATRWVVKPLLVNENIPQTSSVLRTSISQRRSSLPKGLECLMPFDEDEETCGPIYEDPASGIKYDVTLVEMLVTNFLLVKVMIPWVLLYPEESGLQRSGGTKANIVAHNCQVLASSFYLLVRTLRNELLPVREDLIAQAEANALQSAILKQKEEQLAQAEITEGTQVAAGSPASAVNTLQRLRRISMGDKLPNANPSDNPNPNPSPNVEVGMSLLDNMKNKVPLENGDILRGLLPDSYFISVKDPLEGWLPALATQVKDWLTRVVHMVMIEVVAEREAAAKRRIEV